MQEITVNGYSMSFPQKFVYPILGEPNCMADRYIYTHMEYLNRPEEYIVEQMYKVLNIYDDTYGIWAFTFSSIYGKLEDIHSLEYINKDELLELNENDINALRLFIDAVYESEIDDKIITYTDEENRIKTFTMYEYKGPLEFKQEDALIDTSIHTIERVIYIMNKRINATYNYDSSLYRDGLNFDNMDIDDVNDYNNMGEYGYSDYIAFHDEDDSVVTYISMDDLPIKQTFYIYEYNLPQVELHQKDIYLNPSFETIKRIINKFVISKYSLNCLEDLIFRSINNLYFNISDVPNSYASFHSILEDIIKLSSP